jgi:single-strand DNA-binding protein
MASLNKVVLIGRLTRDPETRYTQAGVGVCSFSIAVDRRFKDADGNKKTDFFRCTAWRQTAEFVQNYVAKGNLVAVSGSVEINEYNDREGNKRTSVDVQCDAVEKLESKREDEGGSQRPAPTPTPKAAVNPANAVASGDDDPFADQ